MKLTDLVQAVAGGLADVATKPNNLNYVPWEGGQSEFHMSGKFGRVLAGSNRAGKTVGGINEDIWWMTGRHPYLETPPPPLHGRLITVDFINGFSEIIEPALRQWLPWSDLVNSSWEDSWNKKHHKLTLRNGSTLEVKSHDQDLETFAGTAKDFLHVDEECPKSIFNESKMRLLDRNGKFWITMTPVEGITWIYTDLIIKDSENVSVHGIDVRDNKVISEEALQLLEDEFDDEEKAIRIGGKFVPRGGLILKEFEYERHVIEGRIPPNNWSHYVSIDSGYNNPTAILWHAVSPEGVIVTYAEHYRAGWTIVQHANFIHEMNKELGVSPVLYVGDPSMSQRQITTGVSLLVEYRSHGIPVAPGKKDVNAGLMKMNTYLQQDKWFITKDCPNLLKEIRMYRWKTFKSAKVADQSNKREEPNKKDDHAIDSTRYLFSFMPDLRPFSRKARTIDREAVAASLRPGTTFNPREAKEFPWRYDKGLLVPDRKEPDVAWGEV